MSKNILHNERPWKSDYIHLIRIPCGRITGRTRQRWPSAELCVLRSPRLPCPESPSSPALPSPFSEGTPQFTMENTATLVLTPACSASNPNFPAPYIPSFSSPSLCRFCRKGVPIFYRAPSSLISLGTSHQLPSSAPLLLLSNPSI